MVAPVVAALVGTGVGALLNPLTNNIMALVFKLLEVDKKIELWESFEEDIGFIQRESCMLAADQEDQLSGKGDPNNVKIVSMEQVRDLLYEIEDFLDRIMRCNECGRVDFKARFEKDVKKLKARLVEARQRKDNGSCLVVTEDAASSAVPANMGDLVGIEEPKQEILELLESQPEQLRVISIVGFSGSGKTTLARAVYDSVKLDYKAWVVASEHIDARGLLRALLKELLRGKDPPSEDVGVQKLHTSITDILNANRYLIVLDDIEEERWVSIKHTFPRNTRGRIIVTTATQRVAKVCSRHGNNGYVYNMRNLDENHSKKLLEAVLQEHLAGLLDSSTLNVKKCDGHPLSLVSVANYLLGKDSFTEADCKTFWSSLDDLMKEPAFTVLQQVLMNNYRSLPSQPNNLRTGLLYLSVFPNGHPIKRNRLIRRWLAEGYVQNPDPCKALLAADDNFEKLVDRNIIRPIDPSKQNMKVKTCRAYGIIHEFMLYVAMSTKFITSFDSPQRRDYRHLYMDGRPYSARASNVKEELRAHSLTICGNAGKAVEDFDACELLRVLDLEECDDLEDKDMDGIHKLWHLKYLSLGAKVSRLPREIEQLHCLETLDMRKTKMKPLPVELPAEVIKLPHLVRLLGKFKLKKGDWKNPGLASFLKKKSNLQTLAGFVMDDEDPGFSMLMDKMKKLSKVKIWFNSTGNGVMRPNLVTAIEAFVVKRLDTGNGDHSLSLDLGSSSKDILSSLDISSGGYVSSLKLHGELSGLTMFAKSLCGLTELCLSSSANDLMTNHLSNLRDHLIHLVYLKLVKVNLEGFLFTRSDFRALQSLCLVQCRMLPEIEEGALPSLLSLRLLDQGLEGLSGIDMKRHLLLQEIALDSEVKQETKMKWEGAAKTHPKRPRVFYLQRVDPDGTGSMVKYVAVKKPIPETESSAERGKRKIHEVKSSSVTHVESKFKQMRFAGPSLASTEMPSSSRTVP